MNNTLQQIAETLERLTPTWGPFLKQTQGLDLQAADLAAELGRPLSVDRTVPGFEQFAPEGTRAVEPGDPAASLLYHALASPNVCPAGMTANDYPTWAELDVVENYIYAAKPITAAELAGKVVAVFAYQYRSRPATTHQLYADLVFSRTGFSRVGNTEPFYIGADRGYTSYTGQAREVAVLPARYGVFLAEWRCGSDDQLSMIGEEVEGDSGRNFLYPVRKLFPGDECVSGVTLSLDFKELHLSTKLLRVVNGEGTPDGRPLTLPAGLDMTRKPFVRQSPDEELARMDAVGPASVMVRPPAAALVRLAKQENTSTGRDEIARFQVSPAVVPSVADVVTALTCSSLLKELVCEATEQMRLGHQLEPLISGLGATLDSEGATKNLTGNPEATAASLTIAQLEQVIASAKQLIENGQATREQLGTAIATFEVLLTAQQLEDKATAGAVSDQAKAELAAFMLVKVNKTVLNRHYSSLSMVGGLEKVLAEMLQLLLRKPARVGRGAPEFANIRQQVIDSAYPLDPADPAVLAQHVFDLNTLPAEPGGEDSFDAMLKLGGYEAALFEDGVADGCVAAIVSGLPAHIANFPAFSVLGAPSLFPRSSDLDLEAWWRMWGEDQFAEGDPQPLAEGRFGVNPAIRRPEGIVAAFDIADQTMTAVVGRPSGKAGHAPPPNRLRKKFRTSFLPDAASNEFYPGWDVTIDQDKMGRFFYTTHGLGSPYPEDIKFCSAANGFWPAASPDSARVFHRVDTPTAIPLLDSELGYHPDSPMVVAGEATSGMGWDGGYGPFFQDKEGKIGVNYASMDRTDYVANALAGKFALDLFQELDSEVLIERLDVQRLAIAALPPEGDEVRNTQLWLIAATNVEDWQVEGDPDLRGHGYLLKFAIAANITPVQLSSAPDTQTNRFTRLWQEVELVYTCRATADAVRWWQGSEPTPPADARLYRPGVQAAS